MMRSSSRTVERSRFRRKRIRRRREFQASDIKCTSLDSKGAKPRLNSLGSGTQGPLVQYSCHGHQRGDGPPENETHFQRQLWDAETASEPCEALPYEGGAEDAEEPTCGGDQPEPELPFEAAELSCARRCTRSWVRATRSCGMLIGTARSACKAFCVAVASREQSGHSDRCLLSQTSSAGLRPSTTDSANRRCARRCRLSFMRHLP